MSPLLITILDWITVIGLVVFGIILLIVEIIFVPGTTVVGILGFLFSAYGIYLGYDYFGATTGTLFLLGTLTLNIVALVVAFKGRSWERFSLKNKMTGKFNQDIMLDLKQGDHGMTISSLKPVGKAQFGELEIEVRSNGGFINENVEIEVIRVDSKKVFVEPIKK